VVLAGTFVTLWFVFAVRAVDRNDVPPTMYTAPLVTPAPDLRATVAAANRLLLPEGPIGSPGATPLATPVPAPPAGSPVASPVASPIG